MSRTSKATLAAILAFSMAAGPTFAQDKSKSEALGALMQSMSGGDTSSASIGGKIEDRIREIMAEMQAPPKHDSGPAVTIDEIDKINRAAERERTELEFEKARNERSQLEIQRLLALYDAIKSIEDDKNKASDARQERLLKLVKESGATSRSNSKTDAMKQDQQGLPRIDSISGVGGVFTAEAEFSDTSTTLHVGDMTLNGLTVEKIEANSVVLRGGASGELFQLVPQAPKPVKPTSPVGPNGVLDLSQFPMAQF